jgi:hypothetical protein
MSMRGEIISKEYQSMGFVHDKNGKEYVCYAGDLKNLKKVKTSQRMNEKNL